MKKILFLFAFAFLAQLNNLSAQSAVTINSGDGRITLKYVDCNAYYNVLLHQANGNVGIADQQFKRAECREGMVTVPTNACAAEAIAKATTQEQKEAILFDYLKLSTKEFCLKYGYTVKKEEMQMEKQKK